MQLNPVTMFYDGNLLTTTKKNSSCLSFVNAEFGFASLTQKSFAKPLLFESPVV